MDETGRLDDCLGRSHQLSLRLMHVHLCGMHEGGVADVQPTREKSRIKKASAGEQVWPCGSVKYYKTQG